jgi:hypothetical protein
MHKTLITAALAAAFFAGAAAAQVQLPPGTPRPTPQQQLPPGTTPRPELQIRPACGGAVDLAITSATLYKLSTPGSARVEFDIYNLGPGEWNSGARQQVANLVVRNGASGREYTMTGVPIGGRRFARGERVGRVVSTPIANAFDTFEFSGTVEMSLSFDPDIAIDSNPCNNDANAANNTFSIDSAGVQAFLAGTARSRTFRRT